MMNAMQMPMTNAMMPMMGMPMMMGIMQCDLQQDGMRCTVMPAAGMDMAMFRNSADMMTMMMNCGMPMMMHCGNLMMLGMSEAAMPMMANMSAMPMMGMTLPPMKCMLECTLQGDQLVCMMTPMQGMDLDLFKNGCMLMMKMMDCGMPMMMSCNGMPMMCCTC